MSSSDSDSLLDSALNSNGSIESVISFIAHWKAPVTKSSVLDELSWHASLLDISDALNRWVISNVAAKVEAKDINDIGQPFIAFLSSDSGEFVFVQKITEREVSLTRKQFKEEIISREQFNSIFTGNVLIAEPDSKSGEIDYNKKRRKEIVDQIRYPFVIGSAILILVLSTLLQQSLMPDFYWQHTGALMLAAGGVVISVLLLVQSIDAYNPLVLKLCGIGNKGGCSDILFSKGAKITKELSWAEIGFFFFTGILLLLTTGPSANQMRIIVILNVLALPYTIYSIFYQLRVAKAWCIFCCAIQAILWLLLIPMHSFLDFLNFSLFWSEFTHLFICFLLPIASWVFIKPYLIQTQILKSVKKDLNTFKKDSGLFLSVIRQDNKFVLPEEDTVILGNQESDRVITLISNPGCHACAEYHSILAGWIEKRNDFKLQVLFTSKHDGNPDHIDIGYQIMNLNSTGNRELVERAIEDWFKSDRLDSDVKRWSKAYPISPDPKISDAIARNREWIKEANIKSTPTVLFDGYPLKSPYRLEDLWNFI